MHESFAWFQARGIVKFIDQDPEEKTPDRGMASERYLNLENLHFNETVLHGVGTGIRNEHGPDNRLFEQFITPYSTNARYYLSNIKKIIESAAEKGFIWVNTANLRLRCFENGK